MAGKKISDLVINPDAEADYTREAFIHAAQDGGDVWARLTQVLGVSYDPATRRLFGAGGWSVTLPIARSAKPEISELGVSGLISSADQAKLDGRPESMAVDQDANALTTRGASYRRDGDSGSPTNLPSSVYGILRVVGRAADRLIQYYDEVGSSGTGRLWRRTGNTDGFSQWRSFLMSGDGVAIRDALGGLTGDNRLDAAAIKNLESTIISVLASMDVTARGEFLVALTAGMVEPGDVLMLNAEGTGLTGLGVSIEDVASQQDVLAGTDIDKAVTAEAAGGFDVVRTIPYAATLTIDFTGDTPVWGAENVIPATGAAALQAATFPWYMKGRDFTVRFVRASGSGAITLQDAEGGATVEYRDGLSAGDMPELGPVPGDWVELRGQVLDTGSWCVMDFDARTAGPVDISGGTITTPTGYKVATFTGSGTLTVVNGGLIHGEIVAAGGGAGNPATGTGGMRNTGGGAGEVKYFSGYVSPGIYDVIVGARGELVSTMPGTAGGVSSVFGTIAAGGGGGGGGDTLALSNGQSGGSGGGAAGWSTAPTGGASTAADGGLGHVGGAGGNSATTGNRRGGGGGGAGAAGTAGVASGASGTGGAGVASTCPGISATYAVGGNGSSATPTAPTAPGCGGHGGQGGGGTYGTAGTVGIVHVWIAA